MLQEVILIVKIGMHSCLEGWLFLPSNPNTEKDGILCQTHLPERLYQCQADCSLLKLSMLMLMLQFGPFWQYPFLFPESPPFPKTVGCFLKNLPRRASESTVPQGHGTGGATHQSTCPWSSREEQQELCRDFITSCRPFCRHPCNPLTVWLHLQWATCNFPPTFAEQGCQCCSDSGGPTRFALSCWAGPGESLLSNRDWVKIAEQQQAWSRGLWWFTVEKACPRNRSLAHGAEPRLGSSCCPDHPHTPTQPGHCGGEGFENCRGWHQD